MVLAKIIKTVFGDRNARVIKSFQPLVESINALEDEFTALDDAGL